MDTLIATKQKKKIQKLFNKIKFAIKDTNKICKMLSKIYNIKSETLRMYFTHYVKNESQRLGYIQNPYLELLTDFCKKYNTPDKIKKIYLETMYENSNYIPLCETLKIINPSFSLTKSNIYKIKRLYTDRMMKSQTKGRSDLIHKDIINDITSGTLKKKLSFTNEKIWEEIIKLRNELLPYFEGKMQFIEYLAEKLEINPNTVYVALFLRANKTKANSKRIDKGIKYLSALRKIKYALNSLSKPNKEQ